MPISVSVVVSHATKAATFVRVKIIKQDFSGVKKYIFLNLKSTTLYRIKI